MPKREDERWVNLHPPYCTCLRCVERRLAGESLRICPNCKEKSLFYNAYVGLWECLNTRCKRAYTPTEQRKQFKEPYAAKERSSSSRSPTSSGSPDTYVDKVLTCVNCGKLFPFTVKEQWFYASKGFDEPKRCYSCRWTRRQQSRKNVKNVKQAQEKAKPKRRAGIVATIISLSLFGVFIFWLTGGFISDTEPPPVPTLVSPQDRFTNDGGTATLGWSKVDDPSGVKYEVQVDDNATFMSPEFVDDKIKTCSTTTSRLGDGIYYWRVRAVDRAGNISLWSQTRRFWCYTQPPYAKTLGGQRINLINNWDAKDTTWQQLVSFLTADKIDSKVYTIFSFPCGAFAEEIHNNAEAAGIRAAWVAVDFQDKSGGHALNAFNTTDRGLLYIDCTGEDIMSLRVPRLTDILSQRTISPSVERDKVAYIAIGKQYGLISLSKATSQAYEFYETYIQRYKGYEQQVDSYNAKGKVYEQLLGGRVVVRDPAEYARLKKMYDELEAERMRLDNMQKTLGEYRWEPLGIVQNIKIYW